MARMSPLSRTSVRLLLMAQRRTLAPNKQGSRVEGLIDALFSVRGENLLGSTLGSGVERQEFI